MNNLNYSIEEQDNNLRIIKNNNEIKVKELENKINDLLIENKNLKEKVKDLNNINGNINIDDNKIKMSKDNIIYNLKTKQDKNEEKEKELQKKINDLLIENKNLKKQLNEVNGNMSDDNNDNNDNTISKIDLIIEQLSNSKDVKKDIQKLNKSELIPIVERLLQKNEDQRNQLYHLNNKIEEKDNNLRIIKNNNDKKEKELQKRIKDILIENKNLKEKLNEENDLNNLDKNKNSNNLRIVQDNNIYKLQNNNENKE